MANTLDENIRIIRSTGVYGPDVREAIASAIEESDDEVDGKISRIHTDIEERDLFMNATKIAGTADDYVLEITNPT